MRPHALNTFEGVMNSDTDPTLLPANSPIDALNLIMGESGILGARTFVKGTVSVAFTLPAGTNKVIGAEEDKQTGYLYYFISNSNNNDLILRWEPKNARIVQVATGDFNFQAQNRICGASVVDGLLYWTDGRVIDNVLTGEEPRKINTTKAVIKGKFLKYIFYPDINNTDAFSNGYTYQFRVKNAAGANISVGTFTADGSNQGMFAAGLAWLKDAIETDPDGDLIDYLTINDCDGCKLEFTMKNAEYTLTFTPTDPLLPDTILVNENSYPSPIKDYHISLLKRPAPCQPTCEYVIDTSTPINNVSRKSFQFRVRYIYDDSEKSAWGPISMVALNLGVDGQPVDTLNAIKINFTDSAKLLDPSYLAIIKKVEIAVREGNNGLWKRIKTLERCELGIVVNQIIWRNDEVYEVIPSDDPSQGDPETQVLKLFDEVPLISAALETATGTDSDTRLFLADNLEGYDIPDCVDLNFSITEAEDDCLIDITGTVTIVNNPDEPSANPDYAFYGLNGFAVYLAGTPYYGVSNNPADGTGDGSFTIKNVPKGRYILRVAGYQCNFMGQCSVRENMSNGLEWQRTSSPMIEVAGSLSLAQPVSYERVIDLRGFGGTTFDLDTEVGYGDIKIANAHSTSASLSLVEIYAMDSGGGVAQNDLEAAIAVERLMIQIEYPPATLTDIFTDHNGYVWTMLNDNDDTLTVNFPGMPDVNVVANQPSADQGWKEVYDGPTTVAETNFFIWMINTGIGANFAFLFNNQVDWTADFRRTLSGVVSGADGLGIPGVLVMYQRNDRQTYTDYLGRYSIVIYPENDGAPPDQIRDDDEVFPTYLNDACADYPPTPTSITPDIDPWGNYTTANFSFGFSGGLSYVKRRLKQGAQYKMGIVYEDEGNRTNGVIESTVVTIPFFTESGGSTQYQVNWAVGSIPPIWATHYRLVRSKNLVHLRYFQWMTDQVQFGIVSNPNLAPVFVTWDVMTWNYMFIRVNVRDISTGSNALQLFFQEAKQGYTPQIGDRMRFIFDSDLNPVYPDGILEIDVAGSYVDGSDYYVVVPRVALTEMPDAGWVFEFYTPKGVDDLFYYETGNCYEILDPGTATRRHGGPVNQVLSPPSPASGVLLGGDTYWRFRDFNTVGGGEQIQTENATVTAYATEAVEDIGRAFVLASRGQTWFFNRIRFSGLYIPNSEINGLSSFGSLDYQDINRSFEPITWIGRTNNVLLAICMAKTQPLYLGQGQTLDLRGAISVGRSDSVLQIANEPVGEYGTAHPESVAVESGRVYWWDWYRGVPARYAQDGVNPNAMGKYEEFQAIAAVRRNLSRASDIVIGGYDRLLDLYYLTFFDGSYVNTEMQTITVTGDTYAHSEKNGGWVTRMSFKPECYGPSGTELAGFVNGALWRHNKNSNRNLFYGVAYNPKIKYAVNDNPVAIKRWHTITLRVDRKWQATAITTPRNLNYNSGMSSRLKLTHWGAYEGDWRANFLRDMNDTSAQFLNIADPAVRAATALLQGRELRAQVLIIELEYADTAGQPGTIWHSICEYSLSEKTGMQS